MVGVVSELRDYLVLDAEESIVESPFRRGCIIASRIEVGPFLREA